MENGCSVNYGEIIVIKRDGSDGARLPLTTNICIFGRAEDCDIRIHLPTVSQEHCQIEVDLADDRLYLVNKAETHPTRLNGREVSTRTALTHLDIFTIGDRSFRCEIPDRAITSVSKIKIEPRPLSVNNATVALGSPARGPSTSVLTSVPRSPARTAQPTTVPVGSRSPARTVALAPAGPPRSPARLAGISTTAPPRSPARNHNIADGLQPKSPPRVTSADTGSVAVAEAQPKSPSRVAGSSSATAPHISPARNLSTPNSPARVQPVAAAPKSPARTANKTATASAAVELPKPTARVPPSPSRSPARAAPSIDVAPPASPVRSEAAAPKSPARLLNNIAVAPPPKSPARVPPSPARVAPSPSRSPARNVAATVPPKSPARVNSTNGSVAASPGRAAIARGSPARAVTASPARIGSASSVAPPKSSSKPTTTPLNKEAKFKITSVQDSDQSSPKPAISAPAASATKSNSPPLRQPSPSSSQKPTTKRKSLASKVADELILVATASPHTDNKTPVSKSGKATLSSSVGRAVGNTRIAVDVRRAASASRIPVKSSKPAVRESGASKSIDRKQQITSNRTTGNASGCPSVIAKPSTESVNNTPKKISRAQSQSPMKISEKKAQIASKVSKSKSPGAQQKDKNRSPSPTSRNSDSPNLPLSRSQSSSPEQRKVMTERRSRTPGKRRSAAEPEVNGSLKSPAEKSALTKKPSSAESGIQSRSESRSLSPRDILADTPVAAIKSKSAGKEPLNKTTTPPQKNAPATTPLGRASASTSPSKTTPTPKKTTTPAKGTSKIISPVSSPKSSKSFKRNSSADSAAAARKSDASSPSPTTKTSSARSSGKKAKSRSQSPTKTTERVNNQDGGRRSSDSTIAIGMQAQVTQGGSTKNTSPIVKSAAQSKLSGETVNRGQSPGQFKNALKGLRRQSQAVSESPELMKKTPSPVPTTSPLHSSTGAMRQPMPPRSMSSSPLAGMKRPGSPLTTGQRPKSKKRNVSFGPAMSPEIFDVDLPASTPLRRGAGAVTPKRQLPSEADNIAAKSLLKNRIAATIEEENGGARSPMPLSRSSTPAKTKTTPTAFATKVGGKSFSKKSVSPKSVSPKATSSRRSLLANAVSPMMLPDSLLEGTSLYATPTSKTVSSSRDSTMSATKTPQSTGSSKSMPKSKKSSVKKAGNSSQQFHSHLVNSSLDQTVESPRISPRRESPETTSPKITSSVKSLTKKTSSVKKATPKQDSVLKLSLDQTTPRVSPSRIFSSPKIASVSKSSAEKKSLKEKNNSIASSSSIFDTATSQMQKLLSPKGGEQSKSPRSQSLPGDDSIRKTPKNKSAMNKIASRSVSSKASESLERMQVMMSPTMESTPKVKGHVFGRNQSPDKSLLNMSPPATSSTAKHTKERFVSPRQSPVLLAFTPKQVPAAGSSSSSKKNSTKGMSRKKSISTGGSKSPEKSIASRRASLEMSHSRDMSPERTPTARIVSPAPVKQSQKRQTTLKTVGKTTTKGMSPGKQVSPHSPPHSISLAKRISRSTSLAGQLPRSKTPDASTPRILSPGGQPSLSRLNRKSSPGKKQLIQTAVTTHVANSDEDLVLNNVSSLGEKSLKKKLANRSEAKRRQSEGVLAGAAVSSKKLKRKSEGVVSSKAAKKSAKGQLSPKSPLIVYDTISSPSVTSISKKNTSKSSTGMSSPRESPRASPRRESPEASLSKNMSSKKSSTQKKTPAASLGSTSIAASPGSKRSAMKTPKLLENYSQHTRTGSLAVPGRISLDPYEFVSSPESTPNQSYRKSAGQQMTPTPRNANTSASHSRTNSPTKRLEMPKGSPVVLNVSPRGVGAPHTPQSASKAKAPSAKSSPATSTPSIHPVSVAAKLTGKKSSLKKTKTISSVLSATLPQSRSSPLTTSIRSSPGENRSSPSKRAWDSEPRPAVSPSACKLKPSSRWSPGDVNHKKVMLAGKKPMSERNVDLSTFVATPTDKFYTKSNKVIPTASPTLASVTPNVVAIRAIYGKKAAAKMSQKSSAKKVAAKISGSSSERRSPVAQSAELKTIDITKLQAEGEQSPVSQPTGGSVKKTGKKTGSKSSKKTGVASVKKPAVMKSGKKRLWSEVVAGGGEAATGGDRIMKVGRRAVKKIAVHHLPVAAKKRKFYSVKTPKAKKMVATHHVDSPATLVIGRSKNMTNRQSSNQISSLNETERLSTSPSLNSFYTDLPPTPVGPGEMLVSPWTAKSSEKKRRPSSSSKPRRALSAGSRPAKRAVSTNDSMNLSGIQLLLADAPVNARSVSSSKKNRRGKGSAVEKSPKLAGVRALLKTPKAQKTPKLNGIKHLVKTPRVETSPKMGGIKEMFLAQSAEHSPQFGGIKQLLKTPKVQKSPHLGGIKKLVKTPKVLQKRKVIPQDIERPKKAPKVQKSPILSGIREMFNSRNRESTASPQMVGVRVLMKTPKALNRSVDLTGIDDLLGATSAKASVRKGKAKKISKDEQPSSKKRRLSESLIVTATVVSPVERTVAIIKSVERRSLKKSMRRGLASEATQDSQVQTSFIKAATPKAATPKAATPKAIKSKKAATNRVKPSVSETVISPVAVETVSPAKLTVAGGSQKKIGRKGGRVARHNVMDTVESRAEASSLQQDEQKTTKSKNAIKKMAEPSPSPVVAIAQNNKNVKNLKKGVQPKLSSSTEDAHLSPARSSPQVSINAKSSKKSRGKEKNKPAVLASPVSAVGQGNVENGRNATKVNRKRKMDDIQPGVVDAFSPKATRGKPSKAIHVSPFGNVVSKAPPKSPKVTKSKNIQPAVVNAFSPKATRGKPSKAIHVSPLGNVLSSKALPKSPKATQSRKTKPATPKAAEIIVVAQLTPKKSGSVNKRSEGLNIQHSPVIIPDSPAVKIPVKKGSQKNVKMATIIPDDSHAAVVMSPKVTRKGKTVAARFSPAGKVLSSKVLPKSAKGKKVMKVQENTTMTEISPMQKRVLQKKGKKTTVVNVTEEPVTTSANKAMRSTSPVSPTKQAVTAAKLKTVKKYSNKEISASPVKPSTPIVQSKKATRNTRVEETKTSSPAKSTLSAKALKKSKNVVSVEEKHSSPVKTKTPVDKANKSRQAEPAHEFVASPMIVITPFSAKKSKKAPIAAISSQPPLFPAAMSPQKNNRRGAKKQPGTKSSPQKVATPISAAGQKRKANTIAATENFTAPSPAKKSRIETIAAAEMLPLQENKKKRTGGIIAVDNEVHQNPPKKIKINSKSASVGLPAKPMPVSNQIESAASAAVDGSKKSKGAGSMKDLSSPSKFAVPGVGKTAASKKPKTAAIVKSSPEKVTVSKTTKQPSNKKAAVKAQNGKSGSKETVSIKTPTQKRQTRSAK